MNSRCDFVPAFNSCALTSFIARQQKRARTFQLRNRHVSRIGQLPTDNAVWEACQQVKANQGAAGVDEETIAMFEQDLFRNLYKLWNSMSSGPYFPPR
jgi:retron-type reverse transcriptase